MNRMNELGFYTLAGAPRTPRDLIAEVQQAEALGLGAAFVSERFNVKEAATLSGALAASSSEIGIATAAKMSSSRVFAGPSTRRRRAGNSSMWPA